MIGFTSTSAAFTLRDAKIATGSVNVFAKCADRHSSVRVMLKSAPNTARKNTDRKRLITASTAVHGLARLIILQGYSALTIAKFQRKLLTLRSASQGSSEQIRQCERTGGLPTLLRQGKSYTHQSVRNAAEKLRQKARTTTTMSLSAFAGYVGLVMSGGISMSPKVGRNSRWQEFTGQTATLESTGEPFKND